MKKGYFIIALLVVFLAGCASMGNFPHATGTSVNLEKNNYKMIKTNVMGASSGFTLLFFPITTPQHTVAMSRLYSGAGIMPGGKAYGLANVVQEQTSTSFILFSFPTYRVRADIIEFVDEGVSKEDKK